MPRPRTSDSVRFDPYWKVQRYQRGAWVDIQQRYTEIDKAEAEADRRAAYLSERTRLMEITPEGRTPLPERPSAGRPT